MAIGTMINAWSYVAMFPARCDADFAVHPDGLEIPRTFSDPDVHPFDQLRWSTQTVGVTDGVTGALIFRDDFEAPVSWSPTARQIVCTKFAYGRPGTPGRETSARQVIGRVALRIARWGWEQGYFRQRDDAATFADELTYLLINQYFSFNSPVWFNVGHDLVPVRVAPEADNWRNRKNVPAPYLMDPDGWNVVRNDDIHSHPQVHACMPYGALVNTTDGLLPIGDIVAGSRSRAYHVRDRHGNPSKVIASACMGKRTIIALEFEDGSRERMTSDHRVFVRSSDGSMVEKAAGDVEIGKDRMILGRVDLLADDEISIVRGPFPVDPEIAWLSGVMVGNGYSGRAPSATSDTWECKVNTVAERDRCTRLMDRLSLSYSVKEFHWGYTIRGYGAAARAFWSHLDLWDRTHDKRIPGWVSVAPASIVGPFLNGLFGTDGSVGLCEGDRVSIRLVNASEDVVRTSQVLLRSMGIYATLSGTDDTREDAERQFSWTLGIFDGRSIDRFSYYVGFTHSDKAARLSGRREFSDGPRNRTDDVLIVGKSKGGAELVYDIQTECETFWVSGRLVHNCFIQGVDDSISGIMDLARSEALIFKYGSGTGTDLSTLRSTRETLTGGGTPSGPISFMRIYDAVAGTIKSGGKSRRAAKMQTLKCWHPDILDFVRCKSAEERKARALIASGYPSDFNGDAYSTVAFQNCNMSVRLTDEFMESATADVPPTRNIVSRLFPLRAVKSGEVVGHVDADELLTEIATGSHFCGDPAVQFEDRFQEWHTTPNAGPITSTNPCGEYASINESGCNLASNRLTKFEAEDGSFDVDRYCAAIDLAILSQDIIIDPASYPTAKIAENVRRHRQLGLGYADLGALLMSRGLPYDSDEGRHLCSAITSLMTGRAYRMSATLAKHRGAFDAHAADADNMMRVIRKHESSSLDLTMRHDSESAYIMGRACGEWGAAIDLGKVHGFRNSQASLLAPTGTIGYMMDCDTLGIEPDTALVKHKHLAGGGDMVIVNRAVGRALDRLGYDPVTRDAILDHVVTRGTIGHEYVIPESHAAVFDCAIPVGKVGRSISPSGHVKMMAAAQPFVSGAISKTVNLPESSTVDDIKQIYVDAWKLGLKSITVYRDGSKYSQPVATSAPVAGRNGSLAEGETSVQHVNGSIADLIGGAIALPIPTQVIPPVPERSAPEPIRRRLPDRRKAVVHHFEIAGAHGNFDGYITVGLYDDGRPGNSRASGSNPPDPHTPTTSDTRSRSSIMCSSGWRSTSRRN
jgi:ribonucleoside-diphosphate reductase alpha chain